MIAPTVACDGAAKSNGAALALLERNFLSPLGFAARRRLARAVRTP
jgi:hypothetical protein